MTRSHTITLSLLPSVSEPDDSPVWLAECLTLAGLRSAEATSEAGAVGALILAYASAFGLAIESPTRPPDLRPDLRIGS